MDTRRCRWSSKHYWSQSNKGPVVVAHGTPVQITVSVEYRYDADLDFIEGGPYPTNPVVQTDENGEAYWDLFISDRTTPRIVYTLDTDGVTERFTVPPESELADNADGELSIVQLINRGLPPPPSVRPSTPTRVVFFQPTQPTTTGINGSEWYNTTRHPFEAHVEYEGAWVPYGETGGLVLGNDAPLGPAATATAGTARTAMRSDAQPKWVNPDWNAADGTVGAISNKPSIPSQQALEHTGAALSNLEALTLDDFDRETGVAGTTLNFSNRNFQYINSVGYAVQAGHSYVLESDAWDPIIVHADELLNLAPASQTRAPAEGNHQAFGETSDGVEWRAVISLGLDVDKRPMVSSSTNDSYTGVRLREITRKAAGGTATAGELDSLPALPAVAGYSAGDIINVLGVLYQLSVTDSNTISGKLEITGRNPARVGVGGFDIGPDYYSVLIPKTAFPGAVPNNIYGTGQSHGPAADGFYLDMAFQRDNSLDDVNNYGYAIVPGSDPWEPTIGAGTSVTARFYLEPAHTTRVVLRNTDTWIHHSDSPGTPPPAVQSDWTEGDTTAADYIRNKPSIPTTLGSLDDVPGPPYPALTGLRADSLGRPIWSPAPDTGPATSMGRKVATTVDLGALVPAAPAGTNINRYDTDGVTRLPLWTKHIASYPDGDVREVAFPAVPPTEAIIGVWLRAFVGTVEQDRAFLTWGPGNIDDVGAEPFQRAAGILNLSGGVRIEAAWFSQANGIGLKLLSGAFAADTTVEAWEAVAGGTAPVVSGSDVNHAVYEALMPVSLAAGNPSGERNISLGASTVDAGMGVTVASDRVTVDATTPDRLYTIAFDVEVEAVTFDGTPPNNANAGGNRLFFDLYLRKNGVIDESTRQTRYMRATQPWSPTLWHYHGTLTEKLSAGDYITFHAIRAGGDYDSAGAKVRNWRINASGSSLKVDTQAVTGGGGDPGQPAASLDYENKIITFESIPSLPAPATTTFVAVGSGSTLYYRSTNPFGPSAGIVYLDFYPPTFGSPPGQLAGTYVASVNLNVAQTDRVPDLLRVVTREYAFAPLGVPDNLVARFITPKVAATDRVIASDVTKTMDIRHRNKQWARGTTPTQAQRTMDRAAVAQWVGEPIETAAIDANANTPVGTRWRLTHQQTIKGHGILTPAANSDGSKIGWGAGFGTLSDADGSANSGNRLSGAAPRATEIVSAPARHVSAVLANRNAPTPAYVWVDNIRYQTTAEAVTGNNQSFEFSDGTRFIAGRAYAVNVEWSDGVFSFPDRVLEADGIYVWNGHAIVSDPNNLTAENLAPFVKSPALTGGGRFALEDDLPLFVRSAAPSGADPDGIYFLT